jgi:hypothetical protein
MSTTLTNGMIVQVNGNPPPPAQYLVLMGQTCLLPDPPTVENLFNQPSPPTMISSSDLASIPAGPPLTNGATLAKQEGQSAVNLLSWGQACWIVSPQVFENYNFNWDAIQTVSTLPPQGLDITS